MYEGFAVPAWLQRMTNAWLVVPLKNKDELLGFIVLSRSLAERHIDWEDRDLLKTVAQQATGYLVLLGVTEDLAQSQQFDAYNRLSAFVVHDLKNLAAQLSLVVTNADRYRQNSEFIDDAFETVANAVSKMKRMLAALRAGRMDNARADRVDPFRLLEAVVEERKLNHPVPTLEAGPLDGTISCDRVLLLKAIVHLVQNAQEATADDGHIHIRLRGDGQQAVIEIEDNGSGIHSRSSLPAIRHDEGQCRDGDRRI